MSCPSLAGMMRRKNDDDDDDEKENNVDVDDDYYSYHYYDKEEDPDESAVISCRRSPLVWVSSGGRPWNHWGEAWHSWKSLAYLVVS